MHRVFQVDQQRRDRGRRVGFGVGGERCPQAVFGQLGRREACKVFGGAGHQGGDGFEVLAIGLRGVRGWLADRSLSQELVEPAGVGGLTAALPGHGTSMTHVVDI